MINYELLELQRKALTRAERYRKHGRPDLADEALAQAALVLDTAAYVNAELRSRNLRDMPVDASHEFEHEAPSTAKEGEIALLVDRVMVVQYDSLKFAPWDLGNYRRELRIDAEWGSIAMENPDHESTIQLIREIFKDNGLRGREFYFDQIVPTDEPNEYNAASSRRIQLKSLLGKILNYKVKTAREQGVEILPRAEAVSILSAVMNKPVEESYLQQNDVYHISQKRVLEALFTGDLGFQPVTQQAIDNPIRIDELTNYGFNLEARYANPCRMAKLETLQEFASLPAEAVLGIRSFGQTGYALLEQASTQLLPQA